MLKRLSLFTLLLISSVAVAFEAPTCVDRICVGDEVWLGKTDTSISNGIVAGINVKTKMVTVDLGSYARVPTTAVSIKKGCLAGICIGDQVIPDSYNFGHATVRAINRTDRFLIVVSSGQVGMFSVEPVERVTLKEANSTYENERAHSFQ